MNYISTDFYKDFECIADSCSNTCCAGGWGIIIDDSTYQKMIEHEEQLGVPAKEWLTHNATLDCMMAKLKNGRCSMLTENNLCNVVLKLGPEYLSNTCSSYPRNFHQYGNIIEVHLMLSCPAVIATLMDKERIFFLSGEDESPASPYPHTQLYLFQTATRSAMINMLQNETNISLYTRLYVCFNVLDYAIQLYLNEQLEPNHIKTKLNLYLQENTLTSLDAQLHNIVNETNRYAFIQQLPTILLEYAYDDRLVELVLQTHNYFQNNNLKEYLSDIETFRNSIKEYDSFYINFWVYHIFTDIVEIPNYELAKEKLLYIALKFCCIQAIALVSFTLNKKLDRDEYIYIISCISRIMEHNGSFRQKLMEKLHENELISAAGLLLMTLI